MIISSSDETSSASNHSKTFVHRLYTVSKLFHTRVDLLLCCLVVVNSTLNVIIKYQHGVRDQNASSQSNCSSTWAIRGQHCKNSSGL